jgi:hypothetical protein
MNIMSILQAAPQVLWCVYSTVVSVLEIGWVEEARPLDVRTAVHTTCINFYHLLTKCYKYFATKVDSILIFNYWGSPLLIPK